MVLANCNKAASTPEKHKSKPYPLSTCSVGRTIHIYTVYIRHIWQRNPHIYGHKQCIYTVLANPKYVTYGQFDLCFYPTYVLACTQALHPAEALCTLA